VRIRLAEAGLSLLHSLSVCGMTSLSKRTTRQPHMTFDNTAGLKPQL